MVRGFFISWRRYWPKKQRIERMRKKMNNLDLKEEE
jgi:hypothetical protein